MKFYIYKNARKVNTIEDETKLFTLAQEESLKSRGNVDGLNDNATVDEIIEIIENRSNYKITKVEDIETYKGYVLRQLSGYENCIEWGDGNIADDIEMAKQDIDEEQP